MLLLRHECAVVVRFVALCESWAVAPSCDSCGVGVCAVLDSLGIPYREQQGFYPPFYRNADFYLPERNPIVESDGPYHDRAVDLRKDLRFMQERGIRTWRLTNDQVLSGMISNIRYI